jgi:flagella basal body P-ring formation protein FlgA
MISLIISLGNMAAPAGSLSDDKSMISAQLFSKGDFSNADTKSFIIGQARKRLEQHFSSGEYRFDVQPRWIPNQLLRQAPDQIKGVQLDGEVRRYTNFEVIYEQRGNRQRAEIQLKVEVEQKMPVVTKRVEQGEKLTRDLLVKQWVSLSRNSGSYITEMQYLIGKTLRRTLLSGYPVRKSSVSRDLVIRSGDEVKVVIENKGIKVQVTAEAREDGAIGDRINVYSNETRKKYNGEVTRPGVIKWKSTL